MRFRWFVKKSNFDTELNSGRIGIGDICFILDRLRIYTRSSSFDFSNRPIYQGETSTSDSAGTWTVSIDGITELYDGLTIKVKITTGQSSSYSTLNVNNLGANPIWFGYGVPLTSSTPLTDNQEVILTYRTTASASGITVGGTSYTRGWVMSEGLKTTVGTGLKITNGALGLDYGNVSTGNTTKPVTGSSVYDAVPHTYIKTASVSGTTLTLTTQNNSAVNFTDTTYESKSAASGGTDVSLVTTGEKYTWNNKGTYSKPSGGIPKTDLDSSVQTSLGLADTAVQDISGKADKSATVSTVSYDSTNKKLTKTINGTTSNIVTVSTLKTDMSLSKSDVGLGNVTNDAQVKRSEMGVASGVATLDSGGKVPSSQLPSYVDDVIEGYYYNGAFYKESAHTTEITGEAGKIYVDLSTEKTYRWSGSSYVEISSSDVTGIKVGSSGSTITPSGGVITIPAYETGAQVNTITGVKGNSESSYRTGNVNITKSNIGLGNVGNFKAVSTVASQGLSDTEKSNARTNIGAGTSSFSGSYNDLTDKPTIPDAANDGTFSIKTKVGSGTAVTAADFTANQSSADDITFIQGDNITLTTDTTNRTISISATDTTYESKSAASGGTDVSLVTTGEKYTWDNKQSKVSVLGSTTKPVYTSATGTFAECSTYAGGTAVTLNGTSKAADTVSLYAPTSSGTSGQVLLSSGGEPNWKTGEIVHYITNPTGIAGTTTSGAYNRTQWSGTADGITSLYTGLVIFYKIPVAGVSRGVTLNINSLGEHPVVRNVSTGISTSYGVGTILSLIYDSSQKASVYVNNTSTEYTGCWKIADYDSNSTYTNQSLGNGYGVCETEASTTAKTATLTDYALVNNGFVSVKFTYDVPANATLSINGKSAKNIYYNGAKIVNGIIKAGDLATFVYGDSKYQLVSIDTQVISPSSSTDSHIAVFDGTTGKKIKDSGFTIGTSVPSDAVFTDTTYTFDGTYNASTNKAATVSTVTNAINALDGGTIGTGGTGKTITSLSQTNGNVSATFSDISITKSQISDFPTIPAAVAVKGNAETSYRTGNVNLTPANLGAVATSDITSTYSSTGTAPVNGKAVAAALATLPEPMVFKGSLGTGGTITSLPVDGTANVGDTYKVITAGTYASKVAKVGDTFICLTKTSNSNTWELIPSGDEPSGTVTSVAISNGGGLSVSGSPITSSGTITVSHADTSSQASVNNSGRTYIQGITLDTYGHVTGISSATETVVNTDRYVDSASFDDDSTNESSSPIKMTLTRAGSDTSTITANIPKVSSDSAGVVPKGTEVSSQSQLTRFLREDGTWATPSYTVDTNTASAVDNIFKGSNNATAVTYAPYTSQQSKLSFDTSLDEPVRTDRLNLNGYLHATKLYSGGTEVVTDISGKADKATTLAGYGITDAHITSGIITLGSGSVDTKTFVTLSTNQTVSGQKTFSNSIIGDLTGNATTATTAQNLVSKGTSDYFYMADGSISNGYDLIQTMVDEWSADHSGTLASYQCSSTVYDDIFTS